MTEVSLMKQDATGVIPAWLAEVGGGGSKRTPEEYQRILKRFFATGDPVQATTAHVFAFVYGVGLSGREPSPSTITVRLAAINSFYDFALRMGLVTTNPCVGVKRPSRRASTPHGLDLGELKALLKEIPDTPGGLRDKSIILTCVLTGLRRSEIMSMRAGDLSRNGAIYYTVRTKGGKERRRELPGPAFTAITAALEAQGRPLNTLVPEDRIFDISHQTFYAYLRKYGKRAGLTVRPHDLRHTAAKLRRDAGSSIESISSFLGHASIATTALYLARLQGEEDNEWQGVAQALGI